MEKVAIPVNSGFLSSHFGHCENFDVYSIEAGKILKKESLIPPVHEPGAFPRFLADHNVDIILAGGMGQRAQALFRQNSIKVVTGASNQDSGSLINDYLKRELTTGENPCDH